MYGVTTYRYIVIWLPWYNPLRPCSFTICKMQLMGPVCFLECCFSHVPAKQIVTYRNLTYRLVNCCKSMFQAELTRLCKCRFSILCAKSGTHAWDSSFIYNKFLEHVMTLYILSDFRVRLKNYHKQSTGMSMSHMFYKFLI